MSGAVFDHLVVGAHSLAQGVAFLEERLGVTVPPGGFHPRMGTHNHLARLGSDAFLEIIAIDPEAPPPTRPRWFGLDDPAQQARLRRQPRLIAWVAGVSDLAGLGEAALPFGSAHEMTRGDLAWLITLTETGAVPDGVLPALIQWPAGPHPSRRMGELGLGLAALRLIHPEPARIRATLRGIGAEHLAEIVAGPEPRLAADIRRPDGRIVTFD